MMLKVRLAPGIRFITTGFNENNAKEAVLNRHVLDVEEESPDTYKIRAHPANLQNGLVGCWVYKNETIKVVKQTILLTED